MSKKNFISLLFSFSYFVFRKKNSYLFLAQFSGKYAQQQQEEEEEYDDEDYTDLDNRMRLISFFFFLLFPILILNSCSAKH